jgi:hypothetical protein
MDILIEIGFIWILVSLPVGMLVGAFCEFGLGGKDVDRTEE